jgi:MHS family proline/betaine transporter-like MFS transporter
LSGHDALAGPAFRAESTRSIRPGEIIAVSLGNALEWFEIVVYGYFAGVIADRFFPSHDPTVSLLAAFAAFGITFVTRPLGALLLGAYADREGRKAALLISILLMMGASAAIGLSPTYDSIGVIAPSLLVAARLIQGFAVGGEFGSATAFLAEQDEKRRGFYASWQFASQGVSAALATAFGWLITSFLTAHEVNSWGWRVPFLFGAVLTPLGYYIRKNLREPEEFVSAPYEGSAMQSLMSRKLQLLAAIGVIALGTVTTYTILFLPTFASRHLGLAMPQVFATALLTACVQIAVVPCTGALSDRWGRIPICVSAAIGLAMIVYPLFAWLVVQPTIERLLLVQVTLGVVIAAYAGPLPALMSELFPARMRTAGLSISYALSVAIFGGFTPFLEVWLIQYTKSLLAPSFLVIAASVIGLTSLFAARHCAAEADARGRA